MFFCSTMLMVTIALVMAVIVTNLYAKKDSKREPPKFLYKIAVRFYSNSQDDLKSVSKFNQIRLANNLKHNPNGEVLSITESELSNLTDVDCYRCRNRTSDHYDSAKNEQNPLYIERKWKLVTKFVDRFFFWLFFGLSCITQSYLFSQMIPAETDIPENQKI